MGTRMGVLTSEQPKCMTEISATETILSRQLHQIVYSGIKATASSLTCRLNIHS